MKHLFLVSIGPVQEFIASARRTRDLHFGSWFLSELSKAAAYEINQQKGLLIFPAPENMALLQPNRPFNVANRILANIEQEPEELATLVRKAVDQRLYEIRENAYKGLTLSDEQRATAYIQIASLVELMWVALPYHKNAYHDVRRQVETLMAARKNTQDFQRVTWGKDVPKSSFDGQFESVIPENEYPPRNATTDVKREMLRDLYKHYKIVGQAERLSGVDLLKRSGRTAFGINFPSTSHIATLPFLQRMQHIDPTGKQALHSIWEKYVQELEKLAIIPVREQNAYSYAADPILDRSDGALLFEGRLADILGIPSTDTTLNERLLQAKKELQRFYNALDAQFRKADLSIKRPSTYYALLQADGDNMGDLIDALAEQDQGDAQHRKLSRALSHFSESVRKIVEEHQGSLVYSGGDDVLAFLPLHTVLTCAIALKTHFQNALKGLATQVKRQPPTLSVGIAIVHHLVSFGQARYLAHSAEQQAKQQKDKNSLAITVSKRGGEDYRAVGAWGNIDVRLSRLIAYCRDAILPVGMAYELRDLALRLAVPEKNPPDASPEEVVRLDTLREVVRLDTLRILLRKLTVPAGKLPQTQVDEIEDFLRVQLALPQREPKVKPGAAQVALLEKKNAEPPVAQVSIETFINELVIAQILAEAADLALLEKE